MALEVRPVTSRRDLVRFIKLPFRLYKDEENWVPPLIYERRKHLDRSKNPFFEHAEAEYFLAWRDGQPVGRICAHVDHRLNEVQGNDWGLFGFFEAENDQEVANALFAAAERWNRERGRDRIVGPLDFSTNHECGLLVEGHELKPQVLEFWHHPYYRGLFENAGMAKAMDLYKWELHISDREKMLPVLFELADKVEPEHGVHVRHMRKKDFEDEVRRFVEIYNAAWEKNWGFVPLTDAEIRDYAKQLKPLLDEDWAWMAEKDGETVGAALTLLDWNQVLAKLNGRLFPFGWARFLTDRNKIDRVRVFALGVKPEYQHTGVAAKFYVEHFDMSARTRVKAGEMGWILEVNKAMNRGMEAMGGRIVKRYRLFEKVLGEE
jgi:GNAT superfamily N-acetyltransferase